MPDELDQVDGLALGETNQLVVLAPLQCLSPSNWRVRAAVAPGAASPKPTE
jgi:hypothetical protein